MQDRLLFEQTTLPNGITLYSHAMDVPLFSLHVLIPVGSIHSHEGNPGGRHGIAHFLEHMTFMRSKRYPGVRSFDKLAAEHGAMLNAYTAPQYTNIYVHAPVAAQREVAEGIASMLFEPLFDEEDIAPERGVVANERNQRKYFPGNSEITQYISHGWMHDEHLTKEQLFGSDADLAAMTPGLLARFHAHYETGAVRIVAAGGHDPAVVADAFGGRGTATVDLTGRSIPISWAAREYHEKRFRDIDAPVLYVGGLIPSYDMRTDILLSFILRYLSNPSHGPIYDWLRNRNGWTYGISAGSDTDRDRISWVLRMPLNDAAAVPQIRRELRERSRAALADQGAIRAQVSRELNRAVFNFQTADARADAAVDMLAQTDAIMLESALDALLGAITSEALLAVFDQHLAPERIGEFLALPEQA